MEVVERLHLPVGSQQPRQLLGKARIMIERKAVQKYHEIWQAVIVLHLGAQIFLTEQRRCGDAQLESLIIARITHQIAQQTRALLSSPWVCVRNDMDVALL